MFIWWCWWWWSWSWSWWCWCWCWCWCCCWWCWCWCWCWSWCWCWCCCWWWWWWWWWWLWMFLVIMIIICVYIFIYVYIINIRWPYVYIYIYTPIQAHRVWARIFYIPVKKKYIIMCVCVCVLNFLYNPPIPVGHSSNRAVGHGRMQRSTSSMSETSACQIPRYHSLSEAPWGLRGPPCLGKSLVHRGEAPVYDSEVDAHNLVN